MRNNCRGWGSTNFQGLVDIIVKTRKENPEIPLEDFPKTLLVVSDMQFNPAGYSEHRAGKNVELTNYQTAIKKLSAVFPKEFVDEFKIIWWYCAGRATNDYASTKEDKGTYLVSGFDGSVISFILGKNLDETPNKKAPTMEEVVNDALHQEVLELLKNVD